jgi:signal transduction histidine kinase
MAKTLLFGPLVIMAAVLLRRRPISALTITLGALLITGLADADPSQAVIVLGCLAAIEVCCIAATRSRSISVPAALTVWVVLLAIWLRPGRMPFPHRGSILAGAVLTVIAWLIGHSIRQAQIQAELRRSQAAAQAVTEERLRIARELHDMVAHSIGIIAIQAGAGGRVIDTHPAEARDALAAIEATSRETLAGLRRMLAGLRRAEPGRHPNASGLDPAPGLADVDRLAAMTLDAGVQVDVHWQGDRRPLPADIDLSAFRIIQEAVTNVVRHSGTAQCRVCIDHRDHEVAIEVVDSGRGGVVGGPGYGILGMRERAGLLGGEFSAGPRPGGGFRVAARLPVPVSAQ